MTVFVALLPAYFLSIFYRSFLSVIAGPVSADLGIGPRELGLLGAAWFVTFALAQFPVGWALDRVGPRRTVGIAMALGSAGAALFALAPNVGLAFVGMALLGLGCSPIFMAALFLFARTADPVRFASLTSVFLGLGSFGNVVGAAPLAIAAEAYGWRPAMLGMAGLFLAATLLAVALMRDPPRAEPAASGDDGLLSGLTAILRIGPLWLLAPITLFSYAIVATARGLWIAPFMQQVQGLGPVAAGHVATAMALAMIAGAFAYGWAERRIGRSKPLVLYGTLATATCFSVLALAGHASLALAAGVFTLLGATGYTYAILMAHARQFFPPSLTGRGMTAMNFLFIAGAALAQSASGWLIAGQREAGVGAAESFATLHIGFAIVLVAIALVYMRAPEPARRG